MKFYWKTATFIYLCMAASALQWTRVVVVAHQDLNIWCLAFYRKSMLTLFWMLCPYDAGTSVMRYKLLSITAAPPL